MTITVSVLRDAQKFVRRPDEEDGKDRERLTQTVLERVNVNRPFRQMATFFASTQYSHVVPQFVREPARSDPWSAPAIACLRPGMLAYCGHVAADHRMSQSLLMLPCAKEGYRCKREHAD